MNGVILGFTKILKLLSCMIKKYDTPGPQFTQASIITMALGKELEQYQ